MTEEVRMCECSAGCGVVVTHRLKRNRSRTIQLLTRTDLDGKRYYRTDPTGTWIRLKYQGDFANLNAAIDRWHF